MNTFSLEDQIFFTSLGFLWNSDAAQYELLAKPGNFLFEKRGYNIFIKKNKVSYLLIRNPECSALFSLGESFDLRVKELKLKRFRSRKSMMKFLSLPVELRPKLLAVAQGSYGRGVFAQENIKEGDLIEICPVLLLPSRNFSKPEELHIQDKQLMRYQFAWSPKCEALALGFGSLYNHALDPNAEFKRVFLNDTITFIARREIKKDEEIFVDYQYDPLNEVNQEVNLFFESL